MLELQESVRDTIVAVVEGCDEAQNATSGKDAFINPKFGPRRRGYTTPVEFDVALAEAKGGKGSAAIGVFLAGLGRPTE